MGIKDFMDRCREMAGDDVDDEVIEEVKKEHDRLSSAEEKLNKIREILK